MHVTIIAEDFQGKAEIKVMPGQTINNFMSSLQFYQGEEKMRFIIENWSKINIEDLKLCMSGGKKYKDELEELNWKIDELNDEIYKLENQ